MHMVRVRSDCSLYWGLHCGQGVAYLCTCLMNSLSLAERSSFLKSSKLELIHILTAWITLEREGEDR